MRTKPYLLLSSTMFLPTLLLSIILSSTTYAIAGQSVPTGCQSERVKLQMLGTRGPEFLDGNASTGYLIWLDNKERIIVDAGPGSLQRFKQSKANFDDVDMMLFSHFHADHSADFPSYIKASFFTKRKKPLTVIGPDGTPFVSSATEFVERAIGKKGGMYPYLSPFIESDTPSSYKIKTTTVPWSYSDLKVKKVIEQDEISVKSVSTHHGPFPSMGYRVEVGGCSISFTGDMSGRLNAMPDLAKYSDILVAHNAIPEDVTGVAARLHMTPSYIGKMAKQANVKKLLLTHIMKRSMSVKAQTKGLIAKYYSGEVIFPNDLDIFQL